MPVVMRCSATCPNTRPCLKHDRSESQRAKPYNNARWRRERLVFLKENPLCVLRLEGCTTYADTVDHIRAHKGDERLFWLKSNWQPSCANCNRRKALAEEGGWGH